ncbi:MAG: carboxymuconolactone decarboxylase family protein, partial [Hyphomicrobiales bacterium]|nr:carboxymuconolactone decarboxylase family protein [Hyphomicrobiales bacterium]
MARIPYFDISKAEGRAKKAYEKLPKLNIFRMLGHSGELVDGFNRLGSQILYFTKIDPILREIAIIRVGVLSKAGYEVHQHER